MDEEEHKRWVEEGRVKIEVVKAGLKAALRPDINLLHRMADNLQTQGNLVEVVDDHSKGVQEGLFRACRLLRAEAARRMKSVYRQAKARAEKPRR